MNTAKKRALWPYIITAVAVIVIVALLAVFVFPAVINPQRGRTTATSEYRDGDNTLLSPSDYEDLYAVIKKHQPDETFYQPNYDLGDIVPAFGNGAAETVPETAAAEAVEEEAAKDSTTGYSDTNIRTSGVFEGDIVKTDGRYIYSVDPYSGQFNIIDAEKEMQMVYSGMLLEDYYKCREFYVKGDRLFVTGYKDIYSYDEGGSWQGMSFLLTYDITDRTSPALTDTYTQSGQYDSARITGDTFYLITNYYCYDLDNENYIPSFNGEKIACEDIYYGKLFDHANYYCIGAVSLSDPGHCKSAKAVLTSGSQIYVSDNTFYVISNNWINEKNHSFSRTDIVSIGYEDGILTGKAIGSVDGYINDSFSIDEYNGYLRLVTTSESYTSYERTFLEKWFQTGYYETNDKENGVNNSLWILNDSLSVISSIEKIQKDELVQSARFMEDIVYFVTFRNTDPLFAADLSDPYHPKMLNGLQLTGFSNYLHPWAEDLLVGIGYEATESGSVTGAKLSMFDTSDPKDIRETDRFVLEDTHNVNMLGSDYSYKAVLVDPEKNLIGFAVQDYKYDPEHEFEGTTGAYYLFSYDPENGFKQLAKFDLYSDNYWYPYVYDEMPIEEELPEEADIYEEETAPQEDDDIQKDSESTSIFESFSEENATTGSNVSTDINSVFEAIPEQDQYLYKTIQYVRGLYIDDQFYLVYPGITISQYNLNDMKQNGSLPLYRPAN